MEASIAQGVWRKPRWSIQDTPRIGWVECAVHAKSCLGRLRRRRGAVTANSSVEVRGVVVRRWSYRGADGSGGVDCREPKRWGVVRVEWSVQEPERSRRRTPRLRLERSRARSLDEWVVVVM